jgi:hypothetical protein
MYIKDFKDILNLLLLLVKKSWIEWLPALFGSLDQNGAP